MYELAENGSLSNFLADDLGRCRLGSFNRRLQIAVDVLTAILFVHRGNKDVEGCFHRDINSANIVIKRDFTAQLIDFGLAKFVNDEDKRSTMGVKGTLGYIDPNYTSSGVFTEASDIYSFGIVLLELWTGRLQNSKDTSGETFTFEDEYIHDERDIYFDADAFMNLTLPLPSFCSQFTDIALQCIRQARKKRPSGVAVFVALKSVVSGCSPTHDRSSGGSHLNGTSSSAKQSEICSTCRTLPTIPKEQLCDWCMRRRDAARAVELLEQATSKLEATDPKYDVVKANNSPPSNRFQNSIVVLRSEPFVLREEGHPPLAVTKLALEREGQSLESLLKETKRGITLYLDTATLDRFDAALVLRCTILHYSGHGMSDSLPFELNGEVHAMGINVLQRMVEQKNGTACRLAFVSACKSLNVGRAFVAAGVMHVVCCDVSTSGSDSEGEPQGVTDIAAYTFSRSFYRSLTGGNTVMESFQQARTFVVNSPEVRRAVRNPEEEMKKFRLLPDGSDRHDVVLFVNLNDVPQWPAEGSDQTKYFVRNVMQQDPSPSPPHPLLGRENAQFEVLNLVLNRRFVSVVGTAGIGCSSVVRGVCHYINERASTFNDSGIDRIVYLEVKEGETCLGLARQLLRKIYPNADCLLFDFESVKGAICGTLRKTCTLVVLYRIHRVTDLNDAFRSFLQYLADEVRVLVTSQFRLNVKSEKVYAMAPLDYGSTVRLFCAALSSSRVGFSPRDIRTLMEHLDSRWEATLLPTDPDLSSVVKGRFALMGSGVPKSIELAAHNLSREQCQTLLTNKFWTQTNAGAVGGMHAPTASMAVRSEFSPTSVANAKSWQDSVSFLFAEPLIALDRDGGTRPLGTNGGMVWIDHQDIFQGLGRGKRKIQFHVEAATRSSFAETLKERNSRVLHYSGHVDPDGLCLEESGRAVLIRKSDVGMLFAASDGTAAQLCVISAHPDSGVVEEIVAAGVNHVVCYTSTKGIREGSFLQNFYFALSFGLPLDRAFQTGLSYVLESERKYYRLLQDKGDHDVKLFDQCLKIHRWPLSTDNRALLSSYDVILSSAPSPISQVPLSWRKEMLRVLSEIQTSPNLIQVPLGRNAGGETFVRFLCQYVSRRKSYLRFERLHYIQADESRHFKYHLHFALKLLMRELGVSLSPGNMAPMILAALRGRSSIVVFDGIDYSSASDCFRSFLGRVAAKSTVIVTNRDHTAHTDSTESEFLHQTDADLLEGVTIVAEANSHAVDASAAADETNPTYFPTSKMAPAVIRRLSPPIRLTHPGDLKCARLAAISRGRLLILNIQDASPASLDLNRDVWLSPMVQDLVLENFVLWQSVSHI